ncbi:MAG: cation diffusion facilitator family transporter, partial [Candidatus Hodarchaeales archaeon]
MLFILAIFVNLILGTSKLLVGSFIGSSALLADGIDSLLDILMTIFAYLGVRIATKPPDPDHLYGHQKMEIFFSFGIFALIMFSSLQIFLNALDKLISQQIFLFDVTGLIVAAFSIGLKLLLSYSVLKVGTQVTSPALKAMAKNYRTDVFASFLVVISMIFAYFQFGLLDSVMAIAICGLIVYTGLGIFMEGWNILVDKAPSKEMLDSIHSVANSVSGVKEVHLIRARYLQGGCVGDMHVLVDPDLTVREGHD